eukprot:SAG11_NODE_469_length_9207_cov_5.391744_5_plen_81_part_00
MLPCKPAILVLQQYRQMGPTPDRCETIVAAKSATICAGGGWTLMIGHSCRRRYWAPRNHLPQQLRRSEWQRRYLHGHALR